MTESGKLAASILITLGAVVLVYQGSSALNPTIPKDMPKSAHFMQTGYNLQRNEPTGDWIACSVDADRNTDHCRVTDAHGAVIYEGDFLPLNSEEPLPADQLTVSSADAGKLWVDGPAESGPVPVIPLASGRLLVPADDSAALADRWRKNPDELARLESGD